MVFFKMTQFLLWMMINKKRFSKATQSKPSMMWHLKIQSHDEWFGYQPVYPHPPQARSPLRHIALLLCHASARHQQQRQYQARLICRYSGWFQQAKGRQQCPWCRRCRPPISKAVWLHYFGDEGLPLYLCHPWRPHNSRRALSPWNMTTALCCRIVRANSRFMLNLETYPVPIRKQYV